MKKYFVALSVTLSSIFSLNLSVYAEQLKPTNIFVWEVKTKSNNIEKTNYLVGTIHLPLGKKYRLPDKVIKQLDTTKAFAMETSVDLSPEMIQTLSQYMFLDEKGSLKEQMSEQDWNKLLKTVVPLGYTEAILDRIEPWVLQMQLAMPQANLEDVNNTVDVVLKNEAIKRKATINYLETADEDFQILDNMPLKDDIERLMATVNEAGTDKDKTNKMEEYYVKGNLEKVNEVFFDSDFKKYPYYYDSLILKRNANWLPKAESMLKNGNAFIAVGLGHLIGEKGLLEVLKKRGYSVKRIDVLK